MKTILIYCILSVCFISVCSAQGVRVNGKVHDEDNAPIPGARVFIKDLNKGAISNSSGVFVLRDMPKGEHILQITAHSFDTLLYTFSVSDEAVTLPSLEMRPRTYIAGEVVATTSTESELKRIEPIKIDVIDARIIKQEASDVSQVLNRTPGVKIRSSGSVGSGSEVSLNGLQGKAIRIFRDGIPVDYLGRAFDISLLGVDNLERIEVYKGVLPVGLGADALGGGVNFVGSLFADREFGLTYELSSYSTHKVSLNTQYVIDESGLFASLNAQYNTSKNNYEVDVLNVDNETGARVPITTPRFHDDVRSLFTEFKVGFQGTMWADLFYVGIGYSDLMKNFQHGPLMTTPFGEAKGTEKGFIPSLRYRKDLTPGNSTLDFFAAYSNFNTKFTDTSTRKYDWYGNVTSYDSIQGEASHNQSLQDVVNQNIISRINFTQRFSDDFRGTVNYCLTYQDRIGEDPLAPRHVFTNQDPLADRATYMRHVAGAEVSYDLIEETLTGVAAVKWYSYSASGVPTSIYRNYELDPTQKTANSIGGASFALRYIPTESWMVRASYERGVRLPDGYELFGDGRFVLNNFELKPEQSHNMNLSIGHTDASSLIGKYSFEVNIFYRGLSNLIFLDPKIPFSKHINFSSAIGRGAELILSLAPIENLRIGGNITYQDLRRVNIDVPAEKYLEDSRIPNRPFFFYNLQAHFTMPNIIQDGGFAQLYYYFNSVQQFYLYAIPKAQEPSSIFGDANIDTQLLIPSQMTHTAGASYIFPKKAMMVGFEVENITDAKNYDNFKIQKPGRMFHLKMSYRLQDFLSN